MYARAGRLIGFSMGAVTCISRHPGNDRELYSDSDFIHKLLELFLVKFLLIDSRTKTS